MAESVASHSHTPFRHEPLPFSPKSRQIFAEFITQTLIRRPHSTAIHSFRLLFSYRYYCRTQIQVDSWHDPPSLPAPPSSASPSRRICLSKMRLTAKLTIQNRMKSLVFDRAEEDSDGGCDILLLISGVERLTLLNMCLNRELWSQVFDRKDISECTAFKNLKYLELQTGYTENDLIGIAAFLELCPELETLVVDYNYESDEVLSGNFKMKPPVIHIPSLQQVKMKNYCATEKEMYFVELLKMHKVVLQKSCGISSKSRQHIITSGCSLRQIQVILS